jgi:hypothetical protein
MKFLEDLTRYFKGLEIERIAGRPLIDIAEDLEDLSIALKRITEKKVQHIFPHFSLKQARLLAQSR